MTHKGRLCASYTYISCSTAFILIAHVSPPPKVLCKHKTYVDYKHKRTLACPQHTERLDFNYIAVDIKTFAKQ